MFSFLRKVVKAGALAAGAGLVLGLISRANDDKKGASQK